MSTVEFDSGEKWWLFSLVAIALWLLVYIVAVGVSGVIHP